MKNEIIITVAIMLVCTLTIISVIALTDTSGVDYTDSQQVNALAPQDLVNAINKDKLVDLTLVSDENIASIISHRDYDADIDGVRLFYEKNSRLFAEVDRRAQVSQFRNEYPEVINEWLSGYGIEREYMEPKYFADVEYDGKMITTSGRMAWDNSRMSFNPHELFNYLKENGLEAKLLSDGRLVVNEHTRVSLPQDLKYDAPYGDFRTVDMPEPAVITIKDGRCIISNGIISFDGSHLPSGLTFVVKPGERAPCEAVIGGTVFESAADFEITTYPDNVAIITGKNVIGGSGQFSFTGSLEREGTRKFDSGLGSEKTVVEWFLSEGSFFKEYKNDYTDHGVRSVVRFSATVSQRTNVWATECSAGTNCIGVVQESFDFSKMMVSAVKGNNMNIQLSPESERLIEVLPINDESTVTIKRETEGVKITAAGKVDSVGSSDLRQLPEIRAKSGDDSFTIVKNGMISRCTPEDCRGIASARGAGRKGPITHVAAAGLDAQQHSRTAARRNGIQFTGYEAMNLGFGNVQDDLQNAQILMITGHHTAGSTDFWGEGGRLDINDLPQSDSVRAVAFSSCNTIKDPPDELIKAVLERFPNVQVVFGYHTKAPVYDGERVWRPVTPMLQRAVDTGNYRELEQHVVREGIVGRGEEGQQQLGMYVRHGDSWRLCIPGECRDAGVTIAAAPSSVAGG